MVAGFDLYRPLFVGSLGAVIVVAVAWIAAMVKAKGKLSFIAAIKAGTAWSPTDSWVTNITAVASLVTATWTQLGTGSPPLVPTKAGPAIVTLFISFAAAAGLAPVIYASCARQTNTDATTNEGTVIGYLLAAFATLFAAGGEMMALGMFIVKIMPAGAARGILIGFLFAGAAFVVLYTVRTIYNVLTVDTVTASANVARSFLVPAPRRSATL